MATSAALSVVARQVADLGDQLAERTQTLARGLVDVAALNPALLSVADVAPGLALDAGRLRDVMPLVRSLADALAAHARDLLDADAN